MASYKNSRNAEDIKREISAILREMKDPRVQNAMLSIVRIELSKDNSYCKVYLSSLKGIDNAGEAVKALKNASGFIRSELGKRLTLRHVPALQFSATDSIEYSANISKIINDLDIKGDTEDETTLDN